MLFGCGLIYMIVVLLKEKYDQRVADRYAAACLKGRKEG